MDLSDLSAGTWAKISTVSVLVLLVLMTELTKLRPSLSFHRSFHMSRVLLLALAAYLVSRVLLGMVPDNARVVAFGMALVVVLAAFPWLRQVGSGVFIMAEGRLRHQGMAKIDSDRGRLIRVGLRGVQLSRAGELRVVPFTRLLAGALELREDPRAECRIELRAPERLDVPVLVAMGLEAARLSVFGSPVCVASAFVQAMGGDGARRLIIRGFAIDRTHRDAYRADVSTRFEAQLREIEGAA